MNIALITPAGAWALALVIICLIGLITYSLHAGGHIRWRKNWNDKGSDMRLKPVEEWPTHRTHCNVAMPPVFPPRLFDFVAPRSPNREELGKLVRAVWIGWAKEQPNPKPSWLKPWEELSEPDREVDRRIGETLAAIPDRITKEFDRLLESERRAVAFATRVERGEIQFAVRCNEEAQKIAALPLGKTIHESLSDAVKRVLDERNVGLALVTEKDKALQFVLDSTKRETDNLNLNTLQERMVEALAKTPAGLGEDLKAKLERLAYLESFAAHIDVDSLSRYNAQLRRISDLEDELKAAIEGRKSCDRIIMEERASAVAKDAELKRLRAELASWPGLYKGVENERDALRAQLATAEAESVKFQSFNDAARAAIEAERKMREMDKACLRTLQEAADAMRDQLSVYAHGLILSKDDTQAAIARYDVARAQSGVQAEAKPHFSKAMADAERALAGALAMEDPGLVTYSREQLAKAHIAALFSAGDALRECADITAEGQAACNAWDAAKQGVNSGPAEAAMKLVADRDKNEPAVIHVMDQFKELARLRFIVRMAYLNTLDIIDQANGKPGSRLSDAEAHQLGHDLATYGGNKAIAPFFDLIAHLTAQREFSLATFGPGQNTAGVLAHIRKELAEIEANPSDLVEWIDVVLLAFDGAMRNGGTPEVVAKTLGEKFARNQTRQWPDWRTQAEDQPIEHVRTQAL